MKFTKILGVVAIAALALMAFASTASATTLAVGSTKQTASVTIKASLKAGTSALLSDTSGFFANTCTTSTVEGHTVSPFTAAGTGKIGGPIDKLSFGTETTKCKEGNPTVVSAGKLTVAWISGTTNGTIYSDSAHVTVPSALGTLTCTTPETGTDIGTLTGAKTSTEHALMDISASLNCGSITAKWIGEYTVTSPVGLNVEE